MRPRTPPAACAGGWRIGATSSARLKRCAKRNGRRSQGFGAKKARMKTSWDPGCRTNEEEGKSKRENGNSKLALGLGGGGSGGCGGGSWRRVGRGIRVRRRT